MSKCRAVVFGVSCAACPLVFAAIVMAWYAFEIEDDVIIYPGTNSNCYVSAATVQDLQNGWTASWQVNVGNSVNGQYQQVGIFGSPQVNQSLAEQDLYQYPLYSKQACWYTGDYPQQGYVYWGSQPFTVKPGQPVKAKKLNRVAGYLAITWISLLCLAHCTAGIYYTITKKDFCYVFVDQPDERVSSV